MSHRERIITALNHQEPDRCPLYVSFTPEFAARLREDIRLKDASHYNPHGGGNTYELEQILNSVDLRRVVFVADSTTDRGFLEQTLQRLWEGVSPTSPNASIADPKARLFLGHVERAGDLETLIEYLLLPASSAAPAT